jgi:opacity protein-like surface antigen
MYFPRVAGAAAAIAVALGATTAEAQIFNSGATAGKWFVEGNLGAAWGDFDTFQLSGAALAASDSGDASLTGGVGAGFFFTNQLFARLSYRYFGTFSAAGDIAGVAANLDAHAHGLMVGLGFNLDLSRELFLEAAGEIGAAFIGTSGSTVGGVSVSSASETNLAAGLSLGLGYRLSSNMDLLVTGSYHWLGDASTSGNGASLTASDLGVASATIGARFKF